jgi:hypothetical protein
MSPRQNELILGSDEKEIGNYTAMILVLMALLSTTPLAAQTPNSTQPGSSLVVVGILLNAAGDTVVGETVYFSGLTDDKAELVWTVKDGVAKASDIKNPKAITDKRGGFRIEVRLDQLPTGKLFTLGTLGYLGGATWFRSDDGKPLAFQIPPQPTKGGKRKVDVGTVIK